MLLESGVLFIVSILAGGWAIPAGPPRAEELRLLAEADLTPNRWVPFHSTAI